MSMDVLIVVHMQVGLLHGLPKHDLAGVIQRINALAAIVRQTGGLVVWIRHCGKAGDGFEPGSKGWAFLPELDRQSGDLVVEKTLNDSFAGTVLHDTLQRRAPNRLLITGWATDSCVDSTVRSAISRDYDVVIVSAGHTLGTRPHARRPPASRCAPHHPPSQLGLERPLDQPLDPRCDDKRAVGRAALARTRGGPAPSWTTQRGAGRGS